MLVGCYVLRNLLIGIILENFATDRLRGSEDLNVFRDLWMLKDPDATSMLDPPEVLQVLAHSPYCLGRVSEELNVASLIFIKSLEIPIFLVVPPQTVKNMKELGAKAHGGMSRERLMF